MSHEQSCCTRLEVKRNVHILIQVAKQGKWKNIKNEAAETYLEPCQISMMERFSENTTTKNFIIDA